MLGNGNLRSQCDSCAYYKKLMGGSFIYLPLHVVDMLIACKNMLEINNLKCQLNAEVEMKDLGIPKTILGMEILKDRKSVTFFYNRKNTT